MFNFLSLVADPTAALAAVATSSSGSAQAVAVAPDLLDRFETEPINPIGLVAVGGGLTIGLIVAMTAIISGVLNTRAKEQTRREIAAYVAEGSISPDDAERIIRAKSPSC